MLESARVLVVDDLSVNRALALRVLRSRGIAADEAVCGEQGIEMHRRRAYDLIFMDLQMPGWDGAETTRRIRKAEAQGKLDSKVRIVALTSHDFQGLRASLIAIGMDDCLSKPLRAEDLERIFPRFVSLAPQEPTHEETASKAAPFPTASNI